MIGITEHKIKKENTTPISNIDIASYQPFVFDCSDATHGGTGFYIKNLIVYNKIIDLKNFSPGDFESTFIDITAAHAFHMKYGKYKNDLPCTNNAVEGWHNTFNTHANIWKLIDVIKRKEDISRVKVLHIQQGRVPPTPNLVYAQVNVRVSTVVGDYANCAPLDYLRGIAYNITV